MLMYHSMIFVFIVVAAQSEPKGSIIDDANAKMVYLGAVDGKGYFRDDTEARNWTASKTYCESVGLKIATIKTENEAIFLQSKYGQDAFFSRHWVGARDSQKLRAIVWDKTEVEPVNLTTTMWNHRASAYQLCGSYFSNTTSYLHRIPCYATCGVLCQTNTI